MKDIFDRGTLVTLAYLYALVGLSIHETDSLKCYKCLNFDCPEGNGGEDNESLCQSARRFLVKSLSPFYEFGPVGYIGPCPSREERIQWTLLQQNPDECPYIRESATCSLGRLEVVTKRGLRTVVSYATVLGCAKAALLYHIKDQSSKGGCSIFQKNNTGDHESLSHQLTLENCPKPTDYCNAKSFCIVYSESVVKPFREMYGKHGKSFEAGLIISIIVIILVIVVAALLGNFCWNPLARSINYSPAHDQIADAAEEIEIGD